MDDRLGVRLAFEYKPLGDEMCANVLIVLDDSVVDYGDMSVILNGKVRMCIDHAWNAGSAPP